LTHQVKSAYNIARNAPDENTAGKRIACRSGCSERIRRSVAGFRHLDDHPVNRGQLLEA
jgi:hypothetical protein